VKVREWDYRRRESRRNINLTFDEMSQSEGIMYSRRKFLKTAGAAAAVSTFGIRTALSADELNWSIHCDLTGPAAEGGKFQADGFTAYSKC
jgi:hypothetical protein